MKKYDDHTEKAVTTILGIAGVIAIFINLHLKGYQGENIFDAIKDIAGLGVAVAVFFIASKIFRSLSYTDFKELFEKYLHEWVMQNRFLIDEVKRKEGKEEKEFYYMLTKKHHKNIAFQEKSANEFELRSGASDYNKGSFLYTDTKEKQEIIIGINKSLFLGNEYEDNLEKVALKIKERIIDFSKVFTFENSIKVKFLEEDVKLIEAYKRIVISIKDVEKTPDNAKRLIDLIEYIKTIILALA